MSLFLLEILLKNSDESVGEQLNWPAFSKKKSDPKKKIHHSDRFSPAEYEYVNRFFLARPDFPKFHVKDPKITLSSCF